MLHYKNLAGAPGGDSSRQKKKGKTKEQIEVGATMKLKVVVVFDGHTPIAVARGVAGAPGFC